MSETDFAQYITGFLSRYLPGQRNLSKNTITSYRDAFKLFLVYCESEENLKIATSGKKWTHLQHFSDPCGSCWF